MKRLFLIILILLLLFSSGISAASEWLTLEDCLIRALDHNPEIETYRISLEDAHESITQAYSEFLPTVSADYAVTRLRNGDRSDQDEDYLSQSSRQASVRFSQPLFSGYAAVAGLNKARLEQTSADLDLRLIRYRISHLIQSRYFDYHRYRDLEDKWLESIDRLEHQQRIAGAWVGQALAPQLRVLEADIELTRARQQLTAVRAQKMIVLAQLLELIAWDEPFLPILEKPVLMNEWTGCLSLEECTEYALGNRLEVDQSEVQIAIAGEEKRVVRSRLLPRVSADAVWVNSKRDYNHAQKEDVDRNYHTLSLNLSVPLFQGGANITAQRRQQLKIKQLEYRNRAQRNAVITDVYRFYEQARETQSRVVQDQLVVAGATEAFAYAERAAGLGVVSLDELLKAELQLTQAEIALIESQYARHQAYVDLQYAVGKN